MDNHPIPQDVTGFQFKLIGNMTLRQFAYVAFGVIMSVIFYFAPVNILFKIFLIPFFGGSGILIAFLPVEGRPVDVMLSNFLKTLFSPNQFVYQKTGRVFSFAALPSAKTHPVNAQQTKNVPISPSKQHQLQTLLQNSQNKTQNKLDKKEADFIQLLISPAGIPASATTNVPAPNPQTAPPTPPITPLQQDKPVSSSKTEQKNTPSSQLTQAKKDEADKPKTALNEQQIQALHLQRQQLEQQLQQLQTQLEPKQEQPQQGAHNIPKEMVKNAGLPHVSDTPNVLVGIVKDSRGNVLPGMLVEAKDKDGNPVRAFKTNQLGQFVSATPLATGVYTIMIEDPKKQHNFDLVQIIASNQILLPFEIVSHDAREQLRKELFN